MVARYWGLTRVGLYEVVWRVPADMICARLNISREQLDAVCADLLIRRPDEEYWRRLAAGLTVIKFKLPPAKGKKFASDNQTAGRAGADDGVRREDVYRIEWNCSARRRAVLIQLFALARQHGIEAHCESFSYVRFTAKYISISCRLKEKLKRTSEVVPEHVNLSLPGLLRNKGLVPSGMLNFEFSQRVSKYGVRREWNETRDSPLENSLPAIVEAIGIVLDHSAREAEIARKEAMEREQQRLHEENDRRQWQKLVKLAEEYDGAKKIEALLSALEAEPADPFVKFGDRTANEWKRWAEEKLSKWKLGPVWETVAQASIQR